MSDAGGSAVWSTAPTIDVAGLTDRGKVRHVNEDQFLVASLQKSIHVKQTSLAALPAVAGRRTATAHLLIVADGLGGHGGGDLASGTAVETIATHLGEMAGCVFTFDAELEHEFLSQLEDAVARAHRAVRERYATDEGPSPATTLTMAAVIGWRTYLAHVGDSRAYYYRQGRLRQLTRDQTAYEELVDQGVIQEDPPGPGAPRHRLKDVLTSAIGAEMAPAIGLLDLDPGDTLLLCTDGLTKHVPDEDIAGALDASTSADQACRRLVDLTLERGARDNVTVIVGRVATS